MRERLETGAKQCLYLETLSETSLFYLSVCKNGSRN